MRAAEKIRERFAAIGRRRIHLTDADLDVWLAPLTTADHAEAEALAPDGGPERNLRLFMLKATDEEGAKLFQIGDYDALRRCLSAYDLAIALGALFGPAVAPAKAADEAVAAVEADPFSGSGSSSEKPSASP